MREVSLLHKLLNLMKQVGRRVSFVCDLISFSQVWLRVREDRVMVRVLSSLVFAGNSLDSHHIRLLLCQQLGMKSMVMASLWLDSMFAGWSCICMGVDLRFICSGWRWCIALWHLMEHLSGIAWSYWIDGGKQTVWSSTRCIFAKNTYFTHLQEFVVCTFTELDLLYPLKCSLCPSDIIPADHFSTNILKAFLCRQVSMYS